MVGILPKVSVSELKTFGIGAGVGAVITGAIAYKLAQWRIRVKEEETLKKAYAIKDEKLKVKDSQNEYDIMDLFSKHLGILYTPLTAIDKGIAASFQDEIESKCLAQSNEKDPSIKNFYPIAISSILGHTEKKGIFQVLSEVNQSYFDSKDHSFDEYAAIFVMLSNITFTMVRYINELRKIPGEENLKKLKDFEENVQKFFQNIANSPLIKGRDSKLFSWLESKGFDTFKTKREGFVAILKDEMSEVFQEAYTSQQKITATLISENKTSAIERQMESASEFILRCTNQQASQLPKGYITRSKLAGNIAQYKLKGSHQSYNLDDTFVWLLHQHAIRSNVLHTPIPDNTQSKLESDPSAYFNRLINLGGNKPFVKGNNSPNIPKHLMNNEKNRYKNDQTLAMQAAKSVHLYLKYLNIAAALQSDLTRRLDLNGWKGLKESGEYDYRTAIIKSILGRAQKILNEELLSQTGYFRKFMSETLNIPYNQVSQVFHTAESSDVSTQGKENNIFGDISRNNLLHFQALSNVESESKNAETNTQELNKLTENIQAKEYKPCPEDDILMMNLSLLCQEDSGLQQEFQNNKVKNYSREIQSIKDRINKFKSNIGKGSLTSRNDDKSQIDIKNLSIYRNGNNVKMTDFLSNLNTKYIKYESGVLKFSNDLYFANVRELNNFYKELNQLMSSLLSVVDEKGAPAKDKIQSSLMYHSLKLIAQETNALIESAAPEFIIEQEKQKSQEQILLLQGAIIQMQEDFAASIESQFSTLSQLIIENSAQLGEELSTQYQVQLDKMHKEMGEEQKNLKQQLDKSIQDRESDHEAKIEFLNKMGGRITEFYDQQTTLANSIFSGVANNLKSIIENNNNKIETLTKNMEEVQNKNDELVKLNEETNDNLQKLEENNGNLQKNNEKLLSQVEKIETVQIELINFISQLVGSTKIKEFSENIKSFQEKLNSFKEGSSIEVLSEEISNLQSVSNYLNEMMQQANELLQKYSDQTAFNDIKKTIEEQQTLIVQNSKLVESLKNQVMRLQKELNESQQKHIQSLEKQIEDTKILNEKLTSLQEDFKQQNAKMLEMKNEQVNELKVNLNKEKEEAEEKIIALYKEQYSANYKRINNRLTDYDKALIEYKKEFPGISLPALEMPVNKYSEISVENIKNLEQTLNDFETKIQDQHNTLTREYIALKEKKIKEEYDSKIEVQLNIEKDKLKEEQGLNLQKAKDQQKIKLENNKFAEIYHIIDKFGNDIVSRSQRGGIKHLALSKIINDIRAAYQRTTDDETMKKLCIDFFALCMQKQSNYNLFGKQTFTGKKIFDEIKGQPAEVINKINAALSNDGESKLFEKNKADKRFRYRDFALAVSQRIDNDKVFQYEDKIQYTPENITVHRYNKGR